MPQRGQHNLFESAEPPPVPTDAQALAGAGVVIREIQCKSVLNRSGIADYSFNCYGGCTHACAYCYARYMERFHPHPEPWGQFIDVKINAPQALARQLCRLRPGSVFSCSACDGWQPVERHYGLTRQCCQLLLDAGFRLNVLTKNKLVLRDLDLFAGRAVRLGVTLTVADEDEAAVWEPGASMVSERVDVLVQAKQARLETGVMFGPLLPGISDTDEALDQLFALARRADVDHIWTDILNPRSGVWASVQRLLTDHRPALLPKYREMLFDRVSRERYEQDLCGRIRQAAQRAGMAERL